MPKNEFSNNRKVFLIGAGFDRMFGLPNWNELYKQLKSYILAFSETQLKSLNEKIQLLESLELNIMRKFEMLYVFAKKHGYSKKLLILALQKILDINKYADENDIQLMKETFHDISNSSDVFITTNFSNVFQSNDWSPAWFNSQIISKTFVPLHGLINPPTKSEKLINNIVLFETDYLAQSYQERLNNLSSILEGSGCRELHIYGYSLNDIEILSRIYKLKNIIIFLYISYDDIKWRDLQKEFYRSFFNGVNIQFVTPEWTQDTESKNNTDYKKLEINPYIELLKNFKDACTKSNVNFKTDDWDEEVDNND